MRGRDTRCAQWNRQLSAEPLALCVGSFIGALLLVVSSNEMNTHERGTRMKIMTALTFALLGATLGTACTRDVQALDGQQIEQQYGVPGAHSDTITLPDGQAKGTLVPITLANGRHGQ